LFPDAAIGRSLGWRPGEPIKHAEPREGQRVIGAIERAGAEMDEAAKYGLQCHE